MSEFSWFHQFNYKGKPVKIVLTNDDGFGAPGLEVLAACFDKDVDLWVVAPSESLSGVGHRVTTRDPITASNDGFQRVRLEGTPVDCVRVSLKRLCPDADWVIAGINPGANLGSDVYQSGTVAAAREAAILGRRAIAISQYISRNGEIDWASTGHHVRDILMYLLAKEIDPGFFWNVNLPHPHNLEDQLEYVHCPLDKLPHAYEFRKEGDAYFYDGVIHEHPREGGRDVDVCFGGSVAITRCGVEVVGELSEPSRETS